MNIVAWGQTVPWVDQRQVEQDLIISRALVEIFSDPFLSKELRFRGGTALNKLHLPKPLRYSEDIDLVMTSGVPLWRILKALRAKLEPWTGRAQNKPSPIAQKLLFRITPEDKSSSEPIRLKVEINFQETTAYEPVISLPFAVTNPWFTGKAEIATFAREEILATKLRALLQREKGRDLLDLSHAYGVFEKLDTARVVACLGKYLDASGLTISRAQAEERMFNKLKSKPFMADVRPLLSADEAEKFDEDAALASFKSVFVEFIKKFSGEPWVRTREYAEREKMPELA
jgi:predicted nucleotidyltransferase component of viral defense system